MCPGAGKDEGADAADGQSLPSESVEQEATVVVPLASLSELVPGQSSTRHHLPHLAVPRHQPPLEEQPVSLSQVRLVLGSHSPDSKLPTKTSSWVVIESMFCLCGSQMSEEQAQTLLERRVVVALSVPLFTRNIWKNNYLQAALGAELRLQGCSGSALDALNTMGLCQNKDTVRLLLQRLRTSKKNVSIIITCAGSVWPRTNLVLKQIKWILQLYYWQYQVSLRSIQLVLTKGVDRFGRPLCVMLLNMSFLQIDTPWCFFFWHIKIDFSLDRKWKNCELVQKSVYIVCVCIQSQIY